LGLVMALRDCITRKPMKNNTLYLFFALLALTACAPVSQSTVNSDTNPKSVRLADYAYEPQIRTIQLYSGGEATTDETAPATTPLAQQRLRLEFDDLRDQRDSYYARLIHCTYDWKRSTLSDLDFMTEYNEFSIVNFEFSVDTSIPYVHYWHDLPAVKLPGNYVLVVYRGGNKEDLVLSKRFMVYDNRVTLSGGNNLVVSGRVAEVNQQLNFIVNYKNLEVVNPTENIKVVIRQNQRWDNLAQGIMPAFIREFDRELEYRFFDDTKMFKGGNEFRFFDLRSINYPGRNVQRVDKLAKPAEAFIETDKSRDGQVYSQYNDMNGGFRIDNLDYRDASFTNYVSVNFRLKTAQVPGSVYVAGGFNYWNLDEENRMHYDSTQQAYTARVLLKQGWYDYQYVLQAPGRPYYFFEGSHFETENEYEILVYYKPFQPRADLLIGYTRLNRNTR
jgi:hypothetical protein